MSEGKKGVYRFFWDYGRQGEVEGVFIATSDEIEEITGKEVYLGEILGKHSEVVNTVDADDIKLLSDDPAVVEVVEKHKLSSGLNPLGYYYDQKDE